MRQGKRTASPPRLRVACVIGPLALTVAAVAGCAPGAPSGAAPPPATSATSPAPAPTASPPATASAKACPTSAGTVLRQAPGRGRTVALTFDDGPGGATPQVQQVLRRYGVRATFFDVGQRSTQFAAQEQSLIADGHLVANHSWDHRYPQSVTWTVRHISEQIQRTNTLLESHGTGRVCYFRPPGGVMSNVPATARKLEVTIALWSVDSLDWQQPARTTPAATAAVVRRATTSPGDHPVVLMHVDKASNEPESKVHANRGNTVAALPQIIEWYRAHGYRFVDLAGGSGLR